MGSNEAALVKGNQMFKFLVTVVTPNGLIDEVMAAPSWSILKVTLTEQKITWTQAYKLSQVK